MKYTPIYLPILNTPLLSIRMIWNNYSYDKKVEQALMLELLLQGFAISALANLHAKLNAINTTPHELSPISCLKVIALGTKLISYKMASPS